MFGSFRDALELSPTNMQEVIKKYDPSNVLLISRNEVPNHHYTLLATCFIDVFIKVDLISLSSRVLAN